MYLGPLQMSDITMITIAIGAIILIIGFNIGRRFRSNKITRLLGLQDVNALKAKATDSNSTNNTTAKIKPASNNTIVNPNSAGGGNKRAKNKKRREAQQDFAHKWMIGALKGHTGTVLDMDFSSNGKFLASSAEVQVLEPSRQRCFDPKTEIKIMLNCRSP
ncbi:hypothetical protein PV325_008448 [Microctonus aethiopoides]|nr:hypothetical protein PV325_008448 [Microctonus aethiopoides]